MKLKFNPFHCPARLVAALALTLSGIPADAANLTWTTTPGGTITEGSGTWTTGSAGWRNVSGAADANWAANDSAIFGGGTAGTAGTVTLGGSISATKITFSTPFAGNYTLDLAGNTLTTSNLAGSITAGNTTTIISDSAGTGGWNISTTANTTATISNTSGGLVTVNAKITGAGNMYVGGGGNVTLTNDANNFTGLLGKQNGNALTISSIKNSGVASAAGAGNKVQVGDNGIIIYNGSGDSTDRTLEIRGANTATLRNNGGSSALIWTGPISNTSTAAKTFTLGGSNAANNELQGALTNNGTNVLSVTKADAGTWVLSGNNTYTGLTTLSAGTLTLSGNNSGTGGVTLTAGTLNINSTTALGAAASTFNINGGTIDNTSGSAKTLANNNPITLGGSFAYGTSAGTAANNLNLGTGAVSIGASRTITLNGAGALTFGGVLSNTAAAALSVTVTNGTGTTATSALNLGGVSITAAGDTTNPRSFFVKGDGNVNITGAIVNGAGSGSGSLQIETTGILTLTGSNTYTGATALNSGVLDAIDGTGLPTNSTLQIRGGVFQSSGNFTRSLGAGATNVNWINNNGGFAARGGVLNIQLNNGTSSVNWGDANNRIAGEGKSLIFGSATADNRVDFQNGLNLGNGAVATRTITVIDNPNSTADIARISGNITETTAGMGLLKDGTGTLELTGNNTYTGATVISAGKLQVGAGTDAGSIANTSAITNNGSLVYNVGSGVRTLAAPISGTGSLTQNSSGGSLTLTGNNTYTGKTFVNTGTLSFNSGNTTANGTQALGSNTTVDIGVASTSSGTLTYNGIGAATLAKAINALGNGTDTIQNSGSGLLTLSGTITKNGTVLTLKGGDQGIAVSGAIHGSNTGSDLIIDGGTATLSNPGNDYNGPTIVQNAGTLKVAGDYLGAVPVSSTAGNVVLNNGTLNATDTFTLASNRGLAVGPSSGSGNGTISVDETKTLSYGGIIANNASGTGSLVKAGNGTLTLTGNNTYTGATNVTAGTLLANNTTGSATGSGTVTVASGATLGGNGTISGATTVTGLVSPGNGGIGTLHTSSLTWNGATTAGSDTNWIFDLGASNTSDLLVINGDFIRGTGSVFHFDFNNMQLGTYTLVTWTGNMTGFAGDGSSFSTTIAPGFSGSSFSIVGSSLVFSAVPEASTWVAMVALAISAVAMSLYRQRRNIL